MGANDKITGINISPNGEQCYNLKVVYDKYGEAINDMNGDGVSNWATSLKELRAELPNVKTINLVVGWYADVEGYNAQQFNKDQQVDASKITIKPKVTSDGIPLNGGWQVGDYTDKTSGTMMKDNGWSSTPSDESLIDTCKYLKDLGYDVRIYPMLFVDEEDQPWRGHITPKDDSGVDSFFKEYSKFIEHYAGASNSKGEKLAQYIDSIVVGTEMKGMTGYANEQGDHPAVQKFADLAGNVHEIAKANGHDVKVLYAANHDEFSYSYMNTLWKSNNIDEIGIDAYFKLAKKGAQVDTNTVKQGWEKVDKMINEWYLKNGLDKPIVATEFGCASTKDALNKPWEWDNLKAEISNEAMRAYYEGTAAFAKDSANKPGVHFSEWDAWTWDARGNEFSSHPELYGDAGAEFTHGIAINGKLVAPIDTNLASVSDH